MRAGDACRAAAEMVCGERERQHGDKLTNFSRIAELWNAWLKIRREPASQLTAEDVGHMLGLLKKARTQTGAYNPDDYLDDLGYAACTLEIAHAQRPLYVFQNDRIVPLERNAGDKPEPQEKRNCISCKHQHKGPQDEPCTNCCIADEATGRKIFTRWELRG